MAIDILSLFLQDSGPAREILAVEQSDFIPFRERFRVRVLGVSTANAH